MPRPLRAVVVATGCHVRGPMGQMYCDAWRSAVACCAVTDRTRMIAARRGAFSYRTSYVTRIAAMRTSENFVQEKFAEFFFHALG